VEVAAPVDAGLQKGTFGSQLGPCFRRLCFGGVGFSGHACLSGGSGARSKARASKRSVCKAIKGILSIIAVVVIIIQTWIIR